MKRLWIALIALLPGTSVGAGEARPNILFIYTDDQSYKTVGCYPEAPRWVKTPNIDRLADSGVRFERAYLGAWCMPSRAALLTGRQPHAIESMRMEGTYPGSTYDPQKAPFWPAVFRAHGYETAQIGKWHTGVDAGWGRDWDFQIVWNRPKLTGNAGAYYRGQLLAFNGVERVEPHDEYSTDSYTRWAAEYIRGQSREPGKPWYLWLCYGAVHGPTTPAERHKGTYQDHEAAVPADVFGPRPGKPKYLEQTQAWIRDSNGQAVLKTKPKRAGNFDQDEGGLPLQSWIQQMNECSRAIDEGVGELIAALRETGQLENTLVVFSSDQGYAMGEHGLNMKLAPYDAAFASPLIISRAGTLAAGKVCSQSVNSPDLIATFCRQAKIELPWTVHGRDLTPLLEKPDAEWDHPTLMTFTGDRYGSDTHEIAPEGAEYHGVPWWVMLRQGHYKYVRYLIPGETEELYDLKADPEELDNLAGTAAHAALLDRLRNTCVVELRRTDAGFVDCLPPTAAMVSTNRGTK